MLETIRQVTHIGDDGVLRLELPLGTPGAEVELVIIYSVKTDSAKEDWLTFLRRTAGSLADEPMERPDELPWAEREEIE